MTDTITLTSRAPGLDADSRSSSRLSVGVLVGRGPLPAWILHLLARLKQCDFADPILMIDMQEAAEDRGSVKHVLFRLWRRWDYRFFKGAGREDLSPATAEGVSQIEISSSRLGSEVTLTPADLGKVFSANLDVLLDFAHAGRAPSLAAAARFGTWFFPEETCEQGSRGTYSPALVRSVFEDAPVVESLLMVRRFPDGGLDLLSSFNAATDPVSLARGQATLNRQKPASIMRALSLVHQSADQWQTAPARQPAAPPANVVPGNFEVLRFVFRRYARALWSKAQRTLRREQWVIGIRKKRTDRSASDPQGFAPLVPPPDRFYADPFLVEKSGRTYLFLEELPFASNKGIISCLEIDREGNCGPPRQVLEADYHLSYPFVFEWRGEMYMLPETRDSGKICLFRALDFPYRWEQEKIVMENVWAVDPTLVEHAGKFWLFAGGVERHGDINGELHLFFAESPLGPWTPHPLNPVVSDVRRARPAGKLFFRDGYLVRPDQDCAVRYGAAVVLNRVVALSETQYHEEPFDRVHNGWLAGNLGSHTFNSSEHFEAIDGRRLIRRRCLRTG